MIVSRSTQSLEFVQMHAAKISMLAPLSFSLKSLSYAVQSPQVKYSSRMQRLRSSSPFTVLLP